MARSRRLGATVLAQSHFAQFGLLILCLGAVLWLSAALLRERLDLRLRDGAGLAPPPAASSLASLDRRYPTSIGAAAGSEGGDAAVRRDFPGALDTTLAGFDVGMEAAGAAQPEVEAGPIELIVEVQKGDTLMGILLDAGVRRSEAQRALDALERVFAARDLMPGHEVTLDLLVPASAVVEEVELHAIALQPSVERQVSLTRRLDGAFVGEAIDRPLTVVPTRVAAAIASSLSEAGHAGGVPADIMGEVIRAFSYDVDFQRDLQPGDTYEIVFERIEDEAGTLARAGNVLYAAMTLSGKPMEVYRFAPEGERPDFYTPKGESTRKALLRTPIDGARISSGFGMRKHPILGYSRKHEGIDFAAPQGTPIFAAGDGAVVKVGRNGAYGKYILLRHKSGYATAYGHISRFAKGLKPGSRVRQGQVIAYVGNTGRTTGPHLHYEVLQGGQRINPMSVRLPLGEKLIGAALREFKAHKAATDRLRDELRGRVLLVATRETRSCPIDRQPLPC